VIGWNRYGKSQIRLVRLDRRVEPHSLIDLTLDVQLEGAFEPVYAGDNRLCLATDTMKNTVYALARQAPIEHVEAFAVRLAEHFAAKAAVTKSIITATEQPWAQMTLAHGSAPDAFLDAGREQWTAVVTNDTTNKQQPTTIQSGVTNLVVMKTSGSAFAGFPRDAYTTLPDTEDRILATSITANWTYREGLSDFGVRARIRGALLEVFAAHRSQSVQHTLAAMGEAALDACHDIVEVTIRLPNRHHLLVDLTPFGLDNPNEVFVPTEEPFGLIEGTIRR
jgi:urate oxidase